MQTKGTNETTSGQASFDAPDAIFAQVYDRLKSLARRELAKDRAMTLNTTALVHELYERIARRECAEAPLNFLAYAARAMRNIITDRARHRLAVKAGGEWQQVTLTAGIRASEVEGIALDALALDEAIALLAREHPRAARVVELKYYAGLTSEEIASAMQLTSRTITRDWRFARAFLQAHLGGGASAQA